MADPIGSIKCRRTREAVTDTSSKSVRRYLNMICSALFPSRAQRSWPGAARNSTHSRLRAWLERFRGLRHVSSMSSHHWRLRCECL